jgi:hypothetical protein
MSRGAQSFKQGDLTKAIKAVMNAGVKDWRVEIADGKITVISGEPDPAAASADTETSADIRKLL